MHDNFDYRLVEEYQQTDSLYAIEEFINFLAKNNVRFTAWQKKGQKDRVLKKVALEGLNPVEPELKVVMSGEGDFTSIDMDKPLFIHTDSQKYVAEVEIVYQGKNHLFILPPSKLFIKELRKVPRIRLSGDDKTVTFSKNKKEFCFPIADISKTGVGFFISPAVKKYFQYPKDEIQIFKILESDLETKILGHIVYMKEDDNQGHCRVGVQFYDNYEIDLHFSQNPQGLT